MMWYVRVMWTGASLRGPHVHVLWTSTILPWPRFHVMWTSARLMCASLVYARVRVALRTADVAACPCDVERCKPAVCKSGMCMRARVNVCVC
eukprot:15464721-Alexandrium_andersonii.AAC.1